MQYRIYYITSTKKQRDVSATARRNIINKTKKEAEYHADSAKNPRLDFAFEGAEMEYHHFEDLLQITARLPFLHKDQLIAKFTGKIEDKLGQD
ncbi:hypothetical protein F5Y19DRAFT_474050 [Xylariaceae sp. FL1651]|nr:hypothetical protein F5Y19DRAFT_474050 [Xylariaceae sp. FL1651]